MTCHEAWIEAADGVRLRHTSWLPAGDPTALIVFVHGFTEHSGRYEHVAEALCRRGYALHAIDLRGHGGSQGYRAWVRSFDVYVDDVERLLAQVGQASPGKPTFLFGHSMGGTILTLLAIDRQAAVDGLILSAPLLKMPNHLFRTLRYLAIFASRIVPRLRITSLGARYISRDPQVVAAFEADPMVFHGRFPVRTGAEILRALGKVRRRMEAVELPLLLLHGTGDMVTDPKGSRQLHARARSDDKTLRLYEGLYHDLFHEPEREKVLDDVLEWIEARLTPAVSRTGDP
jgi:alpha-beta hydrolase superfamily lysophospholipase